MAERQTDRVRGPVRGLRSAPVLPPDTLTLAASHIRVNMPNRPNSMAWQRKTASGHEATIREASDTAARQQLEVSPNSLT